jgi:transcriptional regulator with XRE-family HTH domain
MLSRIKLILKEYRLHSSDFAEKIGVSRGAISHILSERNKPSIDTIDKILKAFPDISKSWLRDGEGPMFVNKHIQIIPVSQTSPGQLDLFNEKQTVESTDKTQENEYSLKKEVKMQENKTISTVIQNVNQPNIISKKIDKIIFFFNDKTFSTYLPEE